MHMLELSTRTTGLLLALAIILALALLVGWEARRQRRADLLKAQRRAARKLELEMARVGRKQAA